METTNNSLALHQVEGGSYTPSTLLIPNYLHKYFSARTATFGGTKYYMKHLVITYARYLAHYGIQITSKKWKQGYQQEGLELQKKNFKPDPLLWEELRHIGFAYGFSMCKLFTILID